MAVYSTVCPRNCYSTCSFKVHVEDGKIVHIDPHPDNLATPEGICLKGLSYVERANSDKRILYPLKKDKTTGRFVRISWNEALLLIAEKLKYFKDNYGCHSVLFYAASGMSGLLNDFSKAFWRLYGGATTMYGNLCWPAGLEATRLTLGDNKHNAPWDLANARLIIFWGKNAAETNIQQMIPVDKALQNGATVITIDPRRTQTAEKSEILYQIKPGTDAYLALAIANILIEKSWIDKTFISNYVSGFEQFAQHVKKFTPEKAETITNIPLRYIYKLAEYIARIKPMTIVPGYGMQRYTNGGQTIRAILALQVITGNIGKPGACWHYANLQSYIFDTVKEPLSYFPPTTPDGIFRREISMAKLGEDMLSIKNPELKMIWVERGNPVAQNPDTNTILKAFRNLEFRVVVDQFLTDTACEADLVLPAKNMFEQSDIVGGYWNPYVQLRQKVVNPAGEVKPETEIYYLLARYMGYTTTEIEKHLLKPGDETIEQFLQSKVNEFPALSYEKLKEGPVLPVNHEEIAFADFVFPTPSGKIELYSEEAKNRWNVNPLPDYTELYETENNTENTAFIFNLLTPNTKNRIHSQFNNLEIIQLINPEPYVEMNPADAYDLNIKDEEMIRVYNNRGELNIKVQYNFGIKRKCLAITNGWWIKDGACANMLSKGRFTDMGYGTAFHDNMVGVQKISIKKG